MTTTDAMSAAPADTDAFVERLFTQSVGAMDLLAVDLGLRLGLYAALQEGAATAPQLAERTRTATRYVQEWLEQQTITGTLRVEDPHAPADRRRYRLPPEHATVLLDGDDLAYGGFFPKLATLLAHHIDRVESVFRTGEGIPYAEFGEPYIQVQAEATAPQFRNLLTTTWLPSIPDVAQRLKSQPPARVADIACGAGVAAIETARGYPGVIVDGYDYDPESVAAAQANAEAEGLSDRVHFHAVDISRDLPSQRYDLITIFEAVHDMSHPVEVLRAARQMLAEGGAMVVADELTGDSFAEPGELDAYYYSISLWWCLPAAMEVQPSAATGTVMRASTMTAYATEAGFSRVEVLPIDNDFWRFYRLHP